MPVQDFNLISHLLIFSFKWKNQPFQDEDMVSSLRILPIGGQDPLCERMVH